MASIFDINEEYLKIIQELEESGGEITPELEERLNITREQLESKLKAYYAIIKQNEALIDLSKDEKNRLNDRQKTKENLIDRLKKIVVYTVEQFGEVKPNAKNKSLNFDTLGVSLKETDALEIEDVNKIPTMYLKVSYVIKYDDADKLENLMHTNSIKFTRNDTFLVEKDVIKDVLLAEKKLPV